MLGYENCTAKKIFLLWCGECGGDLNKRFLRLNFMNAYVP